jgi:hypothetical protein
MPLARELKERGVGVWLDQWDIPAEADWDKTIDQALRDCDRLLIVLSPASVQSGEVRGSFAKLWTSGNIFSRCFTGIVRYHGNCA